MAYQLSFFNFEEPHERAIHDDTRVPQGLRISWGLGTPGAPHVRAGSGSQGTSDPPARSWDAGRHWGIPSPGHWALPGESNGHC